MSDLRTALHASYAFVRGVERNRAAGSLTLDHLIEEQIQRIKGGPEAGRRPSKLEELDRLDRDMARVTKAVREASDDPDKLQALGISEEGT